MSSLPKGWKYEKSCETYLYGKDDRNGCGVFRENGKWTGNACFDSEIRVIESQKSRRDAMNEALRVLKELRKELG
jgi:hypothetical protein